MKPIFVSHPTVPVANVAAHGPRHVQGGSETDPAGEPFDVEDGGQITAADGSPGRSAESPAHRARAFGALATGLLTANAPFGQLVKLFAQGLIDESTGSDPAPEDGGESGADAVAPTPEPGDEAAAASDEETAPETADAAPEADGDELDLDPVFDGGGAGQAAEAALIDALLDADSEDDEQGPSVA